MNLDEIKELLRAVTETDVTDFELETGDDKLRIRRGPSGGGKNAQAPYVVVASGAHGPAVHEPHAAALPAGPAPTQAASEASEEEDDGLVIVTSPIVGTFYESPSPGSPAFVEIGDKVQSGQVLCIIEAMKLMNEIEAEAGGVIAKRFVKNSQPVEYGEALYAIRPS
ncbi:MAG: acetyl-CoA carboxylase biotin carboxyl carrier protein [Bryobacterales bacterium]|nr:acetyl-CoA carboxylase biotin carboxyl carrier protein [Acidobacteriota bacterium]MCB9384800.1 acetyl-CoA carboxylase biotin carboxyl carrier protein [Bryobacterales bacterium]